MSTSRTPLELLKIILLFAFTLILLLVYSYSSKQLDFGFFKLRKTPIKQFFQAEVVDTTLLAINDTVAKVDSAKVDSSSQKFLFIGDSMLENLRIRMNDYCRKNHHTMQSVIWYSSSSLWYGNCDTLKYFVNKFDPTYVIVSLGANELFIRDIKEQRDTLVRNIIRQIGKRNYLWVGPPNWKDDTGINDLIIKHAGKSHYFPSKNLTYKRGHDGAHPTRESAFMWMDSIAVFMQTKAANKIIFERPDTFLSKVPPTILLQPNAPPGL